MKTAEKIKEFGASETRIYPTVVLRGTMLEKMYNKALLEEEMHQVAQLSVPLEVGTAWGANWYDAH